MQVSYGPPGHRGVSQLVAVGDDEYPTPIDQAVKTGTVVAAGVAALGLIAGSTTLRNAGAGGLIALLFVRAAKRKPTSSAPAAGGGQSRGGGAGTSW